MRRVLAALALSVALSGCAETGESEASDPKSTATASATPTPTPTATPEPEPVGAEVSIECWADSAGGYVIGTPNDLRSLWSRHFDDCMAGTSRGTPSAKEQRALETAFPKRPVVRDLILLYGMCAQNDPQWLNYIKKAGSPGQLQEVAGALVLCPNHPQRRKIDGYVRMKERNPFEVPEPEVTFHDGTYRVGKKVPPDTYFAKPDGDGCYWERTDAAGNIIDNQFSHGLRAEVTVQPTDYALSVRGCGEWRPVK